MDERNIILTGFMAVGKTETAGALGRMTGRRVVDTDAEIAGREGMSVPEIFARRGELGFREMERELCRELSKERNFVIACGGGLVLDPQNRRLFNESGIVCRLLASPEVILERVKSEPRKRPLLADPDPASRIRELLRERRDAYAAVPFHVDTSLISPHEAAEAVLGIAERMDGIRVLNVNTSASSGYSILLGPHAHGVVRDVCACRGFSPKCASVTDTNIADLHCREIETVLSHAGFIPNRFTFPAGEASKTLETYFELTRFLASTGIDRRGILFSAGGGVVGDMGGFAAATYMRGIACMQCPTTLLAMVDSSVGGKTGVDLPEGKNLVGAFKQPVAVCADTDALRTLPGSELNNGAAEMVKHGIIGPPELFHILEKDPARITDPSVIEDAIRVKISVVEADPLEQDVRAYLNLGHTVGHALEKCSDYGIAHGAAVAIGLCVVAELSSAMGFSGPDLPARIERLLTAIGLPTRHDFDSADLIAAMRMDKKSVSGTPKFVLIRDIGNVEHGVDAPEESLREALDKLRVRG